MYGKLVSRVTALACLVVGCSGRSSDFEKPVDVMTTTSVRDTVVVIEQGRPRARLLDVSGDSAPKTVDVVPIVQNPILAVRRNEHDDQLLVLCGGQADTGEGTPERPGLVVITKGGKTVKYQYDSAFDAMVQSSDGNYAFLFFNADSSSRSGSLLFNPNQVAIIDLVHEEAKPAVRALKSFGSSPHAAAFSPPMTINGRERRLAVVLFDAEIAILDLEHAADVENYPAYVVGLAQAGSKGIVTEQVLFSETAAKIYVRAQGSNDVYVVTLAPAPAGSSANDFKPSVNQLEAGVGPTDMALYAGDQGEARLLVASPGSQEALVIDADSSNVTSIPLPRPAQRIRLFEGRKPLEAESKPRALLYSLNDDAVTFLDLAGIEDRRTQNVELLSVPAYYSRLLPLEGNVTMLLHQGTGLSLLDLEDRTVSEIAGPNLLDAVPDPTLNKLWLAPNDDSGRLGFLELPSFNPAEVRVGDPIRGLVTVPSATKPRVVVTHDSTVGHATVLDGKDPSNLDRAFSARGYLLEGVLGGGN